MPLSLALCRAKTGSFKILTINATRKTFQTKLVEDAKPHMVTNSIHNFKCESVFGHTESIYNHMAQCVFTVSQTRHQLQQPSQVKHTLSLPNTSIHTLIHTNIVT